MGRGSSGLGAGGSSGGKLTGGNSVLTQASLNNMADVYARQMTNFQNRLHANPNNISYRDGRSNYADLATAARNMNPDASEYSGLDAIVALDASPMGTTVNIQGTLYDGIYTKQRMRTAFGTGDVWYSSNHSFATNTGTLMSSLGQIRGGRLRENKNVKVSFA